MFQFSAFARESRDQCLFDSFPRLFAAFHALHSLLAPRHPPHALSSLTTLILAFRIRPLPDNPTRTTKAILPRPPFADSTRRQSATRLHDASPQTLLPKLSCNHQSITPLRQFTICLF